MENIDTQQDGNTHETRSLEILNNFEILPFGFERLFFKHWFLLVILGPYLTLVILGGLYGLLNHTFPYLGVYWTRDLFTDRLFITIMCVFAVSAASYIAWYKKIPGTFQQFLEKDHLNSRQPGDEVVAVYLEFIESYQKYLWSKWRYLFIGLLFIFYILFIRASSPYSYFELQHKPLLDIIGFLHISVMYVLFPILSLYLVGAALWILFATGKYLNKLPELFKLKIQPSHPDKCGGFKFLGNFSFRMVLPLLMAVASMSIIVIFINFYWVENVESNTLERLIIFYSPFVLVITYYSFLGPIWRIHLNMRETKNDYRDMFAKRLGKLQNDLQNYLNEGDLDRAEKTKKELGLLDTLHPDKVKYPTWPFDTQVFVKFLIPQIFPLISFVISIQSDSKINAFVDLLSSLFGK